MLWKYFFSHIQKEKADYISLKYSISQKITRFMNAVKRFSIGINLEKRENTGNNNHLT